MRKRFGRVRNIIFISMCMVVCFGCASDRKTVPAMEGQETEQSLIQEEQKTGKEQVREESVEEESIKEETIKEEIIKAESSVQESTEDFSPKEQLRKNEEKFFEVAEQQGVNRQTAESCFEILMNDNIFRDGAMALTGLQIDDIDGNGQADMLVMVLDAKEKVFYGSGSLWFYINEDEPYCFSEEECSYYGWYDAFWDDIDNDDHVEIVFSAQGSGCGAVGDSYKAVFKYRDHAIERMRLPSDFEEDSDQGIHIDVLQGTETDSYSAYCPYFDEKIDFRAENVEGWELPDTERSVGGNARGFFNLCVVDYEGKKALEASEYLYGEGGIAHNVGIAQFLITWKEDGMPEIVDWWIGGWSLDVWQTYRPRISV